MHHAPGTSASRPTSHGNDLRRQSAVGRTNHPGNRPAVGFAMQIALACLMLAMLAGIVERVESRTDWKYRLLSIPLRSDARLARVDDDLQLVGIPGSQARPRAVEFGDPGFRVPWTDCDSLARDVLGGDPAVVHLPYTDFSDAQMHLISRAPTLRSLILDGTQITDAGLRQLQSLQNLENLSLAGTRISDQGIEVISRLRSVRYLNLADTRISSRGLERLAGPDRLEVLNLSRTPIDGAGLGHLQAISTLQLLILEDLPLDDDCVAVLCRLKSLRGLHLRRTGITEIQISRLASLPRLDDCLINGNFLGRRELNALEKRDRSSF
jgi:hypothetical protein